MKLVAAALAVALFAGGGAASARQPFGILGDRACLALAVVRGTPAVTMDRGWSALDIGAEVIVARD